MAILKGFPPSNTISPSVRITEKDLSFIAPEQSFHRAGIVGFASKGPINIPTTISSRRQLNTIFGYPHPESGDPYLIYAAEQYLLVANELYVVRVADTDIVSSESAATAFVEIPSAGGQINIVSDVPGKYRFSKTSYFKWKLNGVLASKTLVVLADEDHPDSIVQNTGYSVDQLVEDLNSQLVPDIDGIEFYKNTNVPNPADSTIGIRTVFSFGPEASLELVSVQDSICGGSTESESINRLVSFQDTGDTVTLYNHGLSNNDVVRFSSITSTTGISINTDYYVVNSTTNTFKLSSTEGGSALALTTNGTGVLVTGSNVNVNVTGLGQGMTVATVTAGLEGPFDFTSVSGDLTLNVVVDGTDNVNIDNVVQTIYFGDLSAEDNEEVTVDELVSYINNAISGGDISGGFEAVKIAGERLSLRTLHHGKDARILVKNDSTLLELVGFDNILVHPNGNPNNSTIENMTAKGSTPVGASDATNISELGLVRGTDTAVGEVSIVVNADSPGVDGNATQVVVKNNIREGSFILEVYNNGVQLESWGNLTKDETSRFYVETFLSLVSDFVRVTDNTNVAAPPLNGTYNLSGGRDGIPADPDDQDSLLIGNLLGMTGIYALSETEQLDLDLVAVPGHSSTGVILALIDMCQNLRSDCMAIIDPPFGLSVKEIVQWQNGAHPLNTTRFDSDFAALYWPWLKIRDTFNNVDVWVPPSGSVMAVYARNDFLAFPWFAPAGLTRGVVPNISDVFSRPTLEERDLMYGNRNAINPIVQYVDSQDFVVWGQKTLQRKPTALDRVNVRRLMFYIEKRIRNASRILLFEPHDEIFHQKFIRLATSILQEVQVGRGLTDFIIKADFELNTPDVIDRNEFRARIGVQPTRAVEFMFLEFSIHRTGSFSEIAESF